MKQTEAGRVSKGEKRPEGGERVKDNSKTPGDKLLGWVTFADGWPTVFQ